MSTTCCLLSKVFSDFNLIIFDFMFDDQVFGSTLKELTGGVLRCTFTISGLNSTSTRANKDLVYRVLLGKGTDGEYTD